uniref:mitogen-activated protein kinase n=1 Tax=Anas platyrhynchos platyrhynchos TaxID=8840 RepID=A0A493U4I2_ANAPP
MSKYKLVGKIGEGTFSDVLKTLSLRDGKYYACKHMKQHFESIEQVNNLSEIQALRRLSPHPNILMLHEVVFDKKAGSLSLICELMDMNIYELIKGRRKPLPEKKIKNYMYQLCQSLDHIHRNGIFHRDVKPENILIKQNTLKLGDFGSCRSIYSKQPYTEYISTRWYRAPECLLTDGYYSYKIDMWSAGCVFYEITSFQPLFPGSNELDQISKIHDVIGTPAKKTLNKFKQIFFFPRMEERMGWISSSFQVPANGKNDVPEKKNNKTKTRLTVCYLTVVCNRDVLCNQKFCQVRRCLSITVGTVTSEVPRQVYNILQLQNPHPTKLSARFLLHEGFGDKPLRM